MFDVRTSDEVASRIVAQGVASSAAAGWAARRSDGRWELSAGGATTAFFDLASLTKPMTAMAVALGEVPRTTRIGGLLPDARGTPTEHATLELLLAHRAGLEANLPLFRPLMDNRCVVREQALSEAARARRADAKGAIPLSGFAPVYSDLGYMLVGEALVESGDKDFGDVLARRVVAPLGLGEQLGSASALESLGDRVRFRELVVPTEVVPWRGGEIRGLVHDENAFALRGQGACGHAGMFGTASAVLGFGVAVLDAIARGKGPLATHEDLDWLVRPRQGGTARAGFDGKTQGGTSSAGQRCGPRTFGHLGFTGTSLWIDPDAEAVVVMLTNRVHPTRDNVAIRAVRPLAHDALFGFAAQGAGR